jgi:hypothetical protein
VAAAPASTERRLSSLMSAFLPFGARFLEDRFLDDAARNRPLPLDRRLVPIEF